MSPYCVSSSVSCAIAENSLVYENNEQLVTAMRTALTMEAGGYERMQSALAALASDIRRESLATLREMIDGR